jgi:hypothetical protein
VPGEQAEEFPARVAAGARDSDTYAHADASFSLREYASYCMNMQDGFRRSAGARYDPRIWPVRRTIVSSTVYKDLMSEVRSGRVQNGDPWWM